MSSEQPEQDALQLSYEKARAELEEIVRRLESSTTNLAETMELWERGEKLAQVCQRWLDEAKSKIEAARHQAPGDNAR